MEVKYRVKWRVPAIEAAGEQHQDFDSYEEALDQRRDIAGYEGVVCDQLIERVEAEPSSEAAS